MTVGGAGKTPVTIWLARALARRGHRVVIASRGYKGRRDGAVTVVSDGRCVLSRYEEAGDEAMVLAARVPGVPVVVGTDRLRVGHDAVTLFDAEILVLDDGFQHHRLARDFDLVCLDSRAGLGNGRVLPAGPLREPLSALAQADALCWIGVMGDAPRVRSSMLESVWPAERPSFYGVRRALDLVPLGAGRAEAAHSLESLRGDRVGLLSGLARPAGLRALVEALGAEVVREERFPDHHAYRSQDLRFLSQPTPPERLCEGEQGDAEPVAASESPTRWITSEKDAYKIQPEWVGSARVDVLRIESAFEEEDSLIDLIEARLRERGRLV
jgi:tetraacyldisaccharide 4'-kinase